MRDVIIPIFAIIFLFGAPVAAWIVSRVLAHNEYMAMIRMGMMPPPASKWARRAARRGWTAPESGWQPGVYPPGAYDLYDRWCGGEYWAQRQLHKGVRLTLIGFAITICISAVSYQRGFMLGPWPWAFFGLVPLCVGLAQTVSALLAGARFGPVTPPNGEATGRQSDWPNAGPQPQPPQDPPYGWRPGSMPEIEKPAPPPDQR